MPANEWCLSPWKLTLRAADPGFAGTHEDGQERADWGTPEDNIPGEDVPEGSVLEEGVLEEGIPGGCMKWFRTQLVIDFSDWLWIA